MNPHDAEIFATSLAALCTQYLRKGLIDTQVLRSIVHEHPVDEYPDLPYLANYTPIVNETLLVSYAFALHELICAQVSEKFHNIHDFVFCHDNRRQLSSLLRLTLSGSGEDLMTLARKWKVALDDLMFFAVYLARPIRHAVAEATRGDNKIREWSYGYCPTCGLWPRMARIEEKEGHLCLWCIGCDHTWPFSRLRCPVCLESNPAKLGYLTTPSIANWRVYHCESCRRYVKTAVGAPLAHPPARLDADYLTTPALDTAAIYEGYLQDFVGFAAFDLQDSAAARNYRKLAIG